MHNMYSYTTTDRHGYSVQFSPFKTNHLLLASSQLYGLAGGGTLFLFELSSEESEIGGKGLTELCHWDYPDGLFDVAWCPYAENIAATASGDGSLQIWGGVDADAVAESSFTTATKPIVCLQEHKNEVYSVDWGEQWNYHQLLSASWDGTIKLWDCHYRQSSVSTYVGHSDFVYCAKFSPLIANLFASVGTDGYLNLWNFDFSGKPLMSIEAAPTCEILAVDWSHFDRNLLMTGSSDGLVRAWDLRNMRQHIFQLYSGEFAVRRLAFSPTKATVLAAANYDFTTRIWDFSHTVEALEICENHTEFVCGLDWNLNIPHQLADCGWDAVVNVFTPKSLQGIME